MSGAHRRTSRASLVLLQLLVFVTYIFGPTAAFAVDPIPEPTPTESASPEASPDPSTEPTPEPTPAPTAEDSAEPTTPPAPSEPDPTLAPSEPDATTSPEPDPSPAPAPGTRPFLVTFASGTDEARQLEILADAAATDVSSIPQLNLRSVLLADDGYLVQLDALRANAEVVRVEGDRIRDVEAAPSDTSYADQWSLPQVGWDQLYGTVGIAGTSTVAVLDTGVDATHPDVDDVVLPGTSVLDGSNGLTDPNGHGTWMAGIVAAETDNGTGIAGTAYAGVSVLPVTVLGADGTGQDSDIIAGVVFAADAGADVILMAFSNPGYSGALQAAIDYAWSSGAVLVAATGNDGSGTATFPAGDRGVIGVASTDASDALAASSNFGPSAFMAAPGVDIATTSAGGAVATISGTSAAAAQVAGAAALLQANEPDLSNGVIVSRLARNADPTLSAGTGNGRLNLARAMADASTDSIQPAGAAPIGDGGPLVGPYLAAATSFTGVASPNSVPAGSQNNFAFTLTAGNAGNPGTARTVTLTVPSGWTAPKTTAGAGNVSLGSGTCSVSGLSVSGMVVSVTQPSGNGCGNDSTIILNYNQATAPNPATTTDYTFAIGGTPGTSTGPVVEVTAAAAATKLVFTTSAQTITAGGITGTITVQRQTASGTPVTSGGALTVFLSTPSAGGVFRNTADTATITQVTIAAGSSSADFRYRDTVAGTRTITAADQASGSDTGLTDATQSVTVNAAAASKLAFGVQPSNATAGVAINPPVTIRILDAFDNLTSSNANVTVAIGTNPGSGTLSGTTTITAVAGVATFSDLSINKAGSGYTLAASSGILTGATSTAFNINAGAATKYLVTSSSSSPVAGSSVTISAQLADANDNAVATGGIEVTWSKTGLGGSFASATSLTDGSGIASVSFTTSTVAGRTYTATATDAAARTGTSASFTTVAGAADPTTSTISADPTSVSVDIGQSDITVQLKDQFGNDLDAGGDAVTLSTDHGTLSLVTDNGDGTYSATLSSTVTGTATVTGTLNLVAIDDDATVDFTPGELDHFEWDSIPDQVAGIGFDTDVTAYDQFDNVKTNYAGGAVLTHNLSNAPDGTEPLSSLSSWTDGVATASVTAYAAETARNLTVTDGLVTETSNDFDVDNGAADALTFTQDPIDSTADVAFATQPEVTIEDAWGNVVDSGPDSTLSISLSIKFGTGTAGAALTCTSNSVGAIEGVAQFAGCSIDTAGTDYQLTATSGAFAADSAAFDIGLRSTSTAINCGTSAVLNGPVTCTVTVTDTHSPVKSAPLGTVTVTTVTGTGTFSPVSGQCALTPSTASASTCPVTYTPTVVGRHTLSASYGGLNPHAASGPTSTTFTTGYVFAWLAPVVKQPFVNHVKAGQNIAMQFELKDALGNPVTNATLTSFTYVNASCATMNPDGVDVPGDSTNTQGLMNLGNGKYKYQWQTLKNFAPNCKTSRLNLGEGFSRDLFWEFAK